MTTQSQDRPPSQPLRIACIGGGPAGLYFALLMKKQNRDHQITVYERNRADDTFGWGVVFSDSTLQNLAEADPESRGEILDALSHWDDIDIRFRGRTICSSGHGFSGIARKRLLAILQRRCRDLGVVLEFEHEIQGVRDLPRADLIIAADGVNSAIRNDLAEHFRPSIDMRRNRFVWLGTRQRFDAFTFIFKETRWGWFQAHAYRFDNDTSTFIVETPESVWRAAGLAETSREDGIRFCETLFADHLDGHSLISNADHLRGSAIWINFRRVSNETWVKDNVVLMGDAAHTAHFSIGSGTKLAIEDAIALARQFAERPESGIGDLLRAYEAERKAEVLKIQSAARNSTEWFENVGRYARMEPEQFAYSLLTRSQRVSHANLRLRDPAYIDGMERWFAGRAIGRRQQTAIPPMFAPFRLRDMALENRIVVSPMATYSAEQGLPGDFHLVHLGARAVGGAGLVFTEMTCVSPEARITPGCAGIWTDEQAAAWRRVATFVHRYSRARICLQLGHSGPKGSTRRGWEGMDEPLPDGNWSVLGPSPVKWTKQNQTPRSATKADMEKVIADFAAATRRAIDAGFDMVELHAAHGYLLSAFISPLTNRRTDDYGGTLENRLRFPLVVFDAMRAAWPEDRPMAVRISATDWHPDGVTPEESVAIARAFAAHGADLIDVSAGQTTAHAEPVYGRMFQTPFSDLIRNETGIATMAVGNIYEADQANSIIAAGRADLVAIARAHLADPYWTLHAAADLDYDGQPWPAPYLKGGEQYRRNLERADQMALRI